MIRRNIIANFGGRLWGITSVYLFVPLYLKFLGVDAYGLVGFYSALLGVLAFADLGFSATLNREMARLSARSYSISEMRDLLRTYEVIYSLISLVLSFLVWVLAPAIAERWLTSSVLQPDEMASAIRWMGVAIAFQLPTGLYVGGLMGLQRQVEANALQIAWGAFRGLGAVLVMWLVSPTIVAFLVWQVISNVLYCFLVHQGLWRALSPSPQPTAHFRWQVYRSTWRYAAGMASLTSIGLLLTQTDKLVVSKLLSLEMLGYYALAGTLATVPCLLANTIASAVFPAITKIVAMADRDGLRRLYHRAAELTGVATVPVGLTLVFFAEDFITAWTGSALIAERVGLVASLLLAGQMLQAFSVMPFFLSLAHGEVKYSLRIGIVSIVLITPLLIYLIMQYGILGAGISWLALNLVAAPVNIHILHRQFLPGQAWSYVVRSVARPLLAALPFVLVGRWYLPDTASRLLLSGEVALVWIVAATAAAMASPWLRSMIMGNGLDIVSRLREIITSQVSDEA